MTRFAYNLQIAIDLEGRQLFLGLSEGQLPCRSGARPNGVDAPLPPDTAPSAEELFDDLASMLKKSSMKTITED